MTGRIILRALLLLVLAANTWSGLARIGFFVNRELGEKALAEARMDEALRRLRASLWWQPGNEPGYALMARAVHLSLANGLPVAVWQDAGPTELLAAGTVLATRSIDLCPADAWAWFTLAEVFRGYQLGEARRRRLQAVLGAGPPAAEGRDAEGTGEGVPGDAVIIAASLQAQDLEPSFFFYRDFLAALELRRDAPDRAAEQLRESFRLMPLPTAHGTLAEETIRDMAEAVRDGIDRSGESPHVTAALLARSRGEYYEIVGRLDLAITSWLDLRRLAGRSLQADCDYNIARLHQQSGEFAESVPYLEQLLAEGEGAALRPSALRLLARAHSELGDHEAAIAVLEEFRDEVPSSFHPLVLMAQERELMGDREEAGRLYRIAARRFPGESGTWSRYIRYLHQEKRYREALEQAREFARRLPDNPEAATLVRQMETEVARLAP